MMPGEIADLSAITALGGVMAWWAATHPDAPCRVMAVWLIAAGVALAVL